MNEIPERLDNSKNIGRALVSKIKKPNDVKVRASNEMRKLVIRSLETGMCSRKTAATTFNLPYATITSIYNRFLKTGETEANKREKKESVQKVSTKKDKVIKTVKRKNEVIIPMATVKKTNMLKAVKKTIIKNATVIKRENKQEKITQEHINFLTELLADNCKTNLSQLVQLLNETYSLNVKVTGLQSKLPAFHYSLKRAEDVALTTVTPEIITDHKEYSQLFLQLNQSGRPLIYFDETEFHVTMRRFAVNKKGAKRTMFVPPPSLRIRNKTVLATIWEEGLLFYKALDEPNSRSSILEYLNGLFVVLSDRDITGAVIIMGNAAFNYCNVITEAIQLAGHEVVFLPACSAFLNPVENLFSQWCHLLRAKQPASEKELEGLVCTFDGVISAAQCQYYCSHVIENATSCVSGKLIYAK